MKTLSKFFIAGQLQKFGIDCEADATGLTINGHNVPLRKNTVLIKGKCFYFKDTAQLLELLMIAQYI